MKEKILGIDTGTNSIGWAIVEKEGGTTKLLAKGTNIFSEGVKIEKGVESSKAADRTEHRSLRKHYWRRKIRKIQLLNILVRNHLCPPVTIGDLRGWRLKKVYPNNEEFMAWQRTEDKKGINPYHFRYICLTEKLDLNDLSQRYILGRALYHLNQRRGFLSCRKDTAIESEGIVKEAITDLSKKIEEANCQYLGEYFYHLYENKKKIRKKHTARKEHYLKEFHAICEKQELDEKLVSNLEKAIFSQRPLKSQKGLVGTCKFEKGKARCPSSHPLYEEFRMYSFLNNIKMCTPKDNAMRYLTFEEKDKIIPKFKRKSKKTFTFEDIAKELAGKNNYCFDGDKTEKPYRFNYQMDTSITGSIVTAQLEDIFGENWLDAICEVYTLAEGKTRYNILNDVWHVLFFYDDEEKLKDFGIKRLQLDEEDAVKFSKISLPNNYASLSLKAIRKILPYMKDYGLVYSKAVFLANLDEVMPKYIWDVRDMQIIAIERILDIINNYDKKTEERTLEQCIKDFLHLKYMVEPYKLNKLYHPSMIELYPHIKPNSDGIYQLGSPRISSVRNPMAMHSLFRLRKVINLLLKEKKIDEDTTIHIEFARELNDANRRNAIQQYQRERENKRNEYRERIIENGIDNPSDDDILKYQLWEEQKHICIYTGEQIRINDFLGENPKYDKEHTIPRSVGGDSTMENLTLCNSVFNKDVKRTKLPSELNNYEGILQRIESWKEKYEELNKRIRKMKTINSSTKEEKDKIIRKRHLLALERDYWYNKYSRFTMTEVPEGFSRRQGVGIGMISKYARMYLKSVFNRVFVVKGLITSEFRKIWGIQDEYSTKERVNHVHHCIDAITIACIGRNEYDNLAYYYHKDEEFKWSMSDKKAQFPKPWPTFVEDIKSIKNEVLVAHYNKDNMPKQTKKKDGKRILQGDTARGKLHEETYYGAIKYNEEVKYVVRKNLDSLEAGDIKNIVDRVVREKIEDAIKENKTMKAALEKGIWMNKEKGIPIKKVRVFTPSIVRPIDIRVHRDKSKADYKQQFHVNNDRNYMMAIYIGNDQKGKEKRAFELVKSIDAANYYKSSNDISNELVPRKSFKGDYPMAYCLKIGTLVLLYDESPEEVWELSIEDLSKRLYKVTGLSSMIVSSIHYGLISLVFHQEARQSKLLKLKNGVFKRNEEFRSGIKMLHTQIKCLVQGVDFVINDLGEIKRLI